MGLLKTATLEQAYGKVGILGFSGAGKSFTAAEIAIGICEIEKSKKVAFFDTETGSDFLIGKFKNAGIELFNIKSRSFTDLLSTIKECQSENIPALIIDSITHVWRDLCESYDEKLHRNGRLQFQDWATIKKEWHIYTDLFINSKIHIIVCGRAGFEYDYSFDERGNKDLIKTGIKMKVENEFGFEPSLVLDMERVSANEEEISKLKTRAARQTFKPKEGSQWIHRCHVMKDRFDLINGQSFDYPTFKSFEQHFMALNIGGEHLGVNTDRNSESRFDIQGRPDWQLEQRDKKITLEEIMACLIEKYPSTAAKDKAEKARIIKSVFGTGSWTAVENMPLIDLQNGLKTIKRIIDPLVSADQIRAIHALYKSTEGITDHDVVRAKSAGFFKMLNLKSMKDLTNKQGREIIDHLKSIEENKAVQQPNIEVIRKKIKDTWLFEIDALKKPKLLELLNARLDKPIERILAAEMEEKSLLILHEILKEQGVYK